ncbi:MAG: N-acetylneuraminate synthase [Candidatus Omnitrophica bacterium]|nr:N-acetylneuraminate synthase [Candidatus Omnitrophota bacterium]MDD5352421.1 N-acetylneuraminate synthase [Candidatus Omnitrophota bacterium]MDD5550019.1 N-acetylneuraminate synthase [Candidatus Omnitrophota bacterium]
MDKKIFIIAEAGVNHNGKKSCALELIDAAYKAGADAIKFQTFKAGNLASRLTKKARYQLSSSRVKEGQLEMLRRLQLSYESFISLKQYCDRKGILFLSTPFDYESVDFLEKIVPAYKIGSGDLNNLPFLKYIAQRNKPVLLSTGMATLKEVKEAVKIIIDNQGCLKKTTMFKPLTLMHCTTSYPCPYKEANLLAIQTLKKEFCLPVGYSDHTIGVEASVAAVALGATIIEKHFTLDKNMPGPDHKASSEPEELGRLVKAIRNIEIGLGDGIKKPQHCEMENIKVVRKSLIVARDLKAGEKICREMIEIKRPGYGTSPKDYNKIIGLELIRDKNKDEVFTWDDFK